MLRAKEQTSEEVGTVASMTVVGGVGNPAEKAEALPASSPPFISSNSSRFLKTPFSLRKLVESKTACNVLHAWLPLMPAVGGKHLL